MITFTVYGEPVAQGRPRASTVHGAIRMHDPAKSKQYKDYVRLAASQHAPSELLTGPLNVEVMVYRQIPKSFSKKKAAEAENGLIFPTTKPDASNYMKGIEDALSGVIWKDDNQIVDAITRKRYSTRPRIEVTVTEV